MVSAGSRRRSRATRCAHEFVAMWRDLLDKPAAPPRTWVLRDFHSPNLIWLGERDGICEGRHDRFPGCGAGPAAYDLVSLLQDARIDVPEAARARAVDPLHQGAARHRRILSIRPVSPSTMRSCRRSATRGCSAPSPGSTGATASRNICATNPGSGPISRDHWPTRRCRPVRDWYAAHVPPPASVDLPVISHLPLNLPGPACSSMSGLLRSGRCRRW